MICINCRVIPLILFYGHHAGDSFMHAYICTHDQSQQGDKGKHRVGVDPVKKVIDLHIIVGRKILEGGICNFIV